MGDNLTVEEWYDQLTGHEQELLRRGIRSLLSRTFLIRRKERELFLFFARNADMVNRWLLPAGYSILTDQDTGTIMLQDRGEEKPEIAAISRRQFTVRDSVIYCALAWIFIDRMEAGLDQFITITPGELTQALGQFDIGTGYRTEYSRSQIEDSLKLLQKYSLIDVKGRLGEEDCMIVIYPTIMFGMDLKELKQYLEDKTAGYQAYYSSATQEDEEDDADEDAADSPAEDL